MRVKFTSKLLSQPGGAINPEQKKHVRYTKCSNCGFSDPGACTFSEVSFHVGTASFQFDLCEWCLTGGALTGRRSEVVFDVKLCRHLAKTSGMPDDCVRSVSVTPRHIL